MESGVREFSLKLLFPKLELWYRCCEVPDEVARPLITPHPQERAQRIALALKLLRPDYTTCFFFLTVFERGAGGPRTGFVTSWLLIFLASWLPGFWILAFLFLLSSWLPGFMASRSRVPTLRRKMNPTPIEAPDSESSIPCQGSFKIPSRFSNHNSQNIPL